MDKLKYEVEGLMAKYEVSWRHCLQQPLIALFRPASTEFVSDVEWM